VVTSRCHQLRAYWQVSESETAPEWINPFSQRLQADEQPLGCFGDASPGLKPRFVANVLRGPEGPLFHGGAGILVMPAFMSLAAASEAMPFPADFRNQFRTVEQRGFAASG